MTPDAPAPAADELRKPGQQTATALPSPSPSALISGPSVTETSDIAASTATTAVIQVGQSARGTIGFSGDHDWWKVDLQAGHTYTFAQIGTGLNALSDSFVNLRNAVGTSIASDDDSGPGTASVIGMSSPLGAGIFTAPTTGSYYIDASGFGTTTGQYGISVVESSSATGYRPSFDVSMGAGAVHTDPSGTIPDWNQYLNTTRGQPVTLTYSFRDTVTYSTDGSLTFSKCTAAEMTAVSSILALLGEACNITFTQVQPGGYSNNAQIVIANYTDAASAAGAYAYYPYLNTEYGGDLWLNTASVNPNSIVQGQYSWFAIMHELGHALGLSHPGDYNAGNGSPTYANSAQFIEDSEQYSIMSYWDGFETGQSPGNFATAFTPLLFDIYQLQLLYGANTTIRTGNTTYGFNNTAGSSYGFSAGMVPYYCIWDAGGVDTLDASGYTFAQVINLAQGSFSNIGGGTYNVSIAIGAALENARGGSGNDLLLGNSLDNNLDGGAGGDTLVGGAGNDTYTVNLASDVVNETATGSSGVDTVNVAFTGAGTYLMTAGVEKATLTTSTSGVNVTGNSDDNTITGNSAANALLGADGNDTLIGGLGNDTLDGGNGIDQVVLAGNFADWSGTRVSDTVLLLTRNGQTVTLQDVETVSLDDGVRNTSAWGVAGPGNDSITGTSGNDSLDGLAGDDTIYGLAGKDTLIGGAGTDSLIGGQGDDTYEVDVAADVVVEVAGEGIDLVNVAFTLASTYTLGANVENASIVAQPGVAANLTGNELDNKLQGNGANNVLSGGAGNDTLDGFAGNDTMAGGAGDDLYVVQEVGDVVDETAPGSAGTDTVWVTWYGFTGTYTLGSGVENGSVVSSYDGINITGNSLANVLVGYRGTNVLDGGGGNDTISGGDGKDTLIGGSGDDSVSGDAGSDVLQGLAGNDTLDGGTVTDTLNLSDANTLDYSDDTAAVNINLSIGVALDGFGGTDSISNFQFVFGANVSAGDTIVGSSGTTLEIFEGLGGDDTIDGGAISDTRNGTDANRISYAYATGGVTVDLAPDPGGDQHASGAEGNDVLRNFSQVRGSDFNDSLYGSDRGDIAENFEGRAGTNTIDGRGGIDFVRYEGAASSDGTHGVAVNLALGTASSVYRNAGGTLVAGQDSFTNIEGVEGSRYDDTLLGGNAASGVTLNDGLIEIFRGGAGNDTIDGGQGWDRADYTSSTAGINADLSTGVVQDGLGGVDHLLNIEAIRGSAFGDRMVGSTGAYESFEGRAGNDTLIGNGGFADRADYVSSIAAVNVNLALGTASDGWGGTDSLVGMTDVRGSGFDDSITGSSGSNYLAGGFGNDTLKGGAGVDTLAGGAGHDVYEVDVAGDVLIELADEGTDLVNVAFAAAGTYVLSANVENATVTSGASIVVNLTGNAQDNLLLGNGAANILLGNGGQDTLDGGLGNDTMTGGAGDDTYIVNVGTDVVDETTLGSGGLDTVKVAFSLAGTYLMTAGVENAVITTGTSGVNVTGSADDNRITGNAAANVLLGGGGDDTLAGGLGNDTLDGGTGTDQVVLAGNFGDWIVTRPTATDTVLTRGGQAVTIRAAESVLFDDGGQDLAALWNNKASSFPDVINGTGGNDTLDGLAGNDTLYGLGGNDSLVGGSGIDSLVGGKGDDTYGVDVAGDVIVELADEGTDQVNVAFAAAGTYVLAGDVENATVTSAATIAVNLTGNELANALVGNGAANILVGGGGNDTLDGDLGSDNMSGGAGDDSYVVNVATDIVNETASGSGGTDTVKVAFTAAGTYLMTAGVENAVITTGTAGVNVTGSDGSNTITGNAAANLLAGGGGDDTLVGGLGNDTLDGGTGTDQVVLSGSFSDWVVTRPTATDTALTRGGQVVTIRAVESVLFDDGVQDMGALWNNKASSFADVLTGTGGNDTIDGLGGNDTLYGLGGDDSLVGGTGLDSLVGGDGNDTYSVDAAGDAILELANEGTDRVHVAFAAAGTFALSANIENATVTAAATIAVNLTGNEQANELVGNGAANILVGSGGNDTLDGGLGSDNMSGGAGDDTYVVNTSTDIVNETATGSTGIDTVQVAFTAGGTYLMTTGVDNAIVTTGTAGVNITGSLDNNRITGNGAANALLGGSGDDTLVGGLGNDTLDGGVGNDQVVLAGNFADWGVSRPTATDTVLTRGGQVVTIRAVESVLFDDGEQGMAALWNNKASSFADVINGTGASDTIDGLGGNDTLYGFGSNDTLVGGAGIDSLVGGGGDDTYSLDVAGDVILELTNEGTDQVNVAFAAAATYALADNVENATVTSAATIAVNVTGNGLNNWLVGNGAANILVGGAGNDTLDGGLGSDNMSGGVGDDTYILNVSTDIVNETAVGSTGVDTVKLGFSLAALYTLGTNIENGIITSSLNGVNLTGNALANVMTGGAGNNVLTGGDGNDSLDGGGGNDTVDGGLGLGDVLHLAGSLADYTISRPSPTQTLFTRAGASVLVSNVELVQFESDDPVTLGSLIAKIGSTGDDVLAGGSDADALDGGGGNDRLSGDLGDDTLLGGAGNDTLQGGIGNDWLDGGDGNDTYRISLGEGDDLILQNDTTTGVDTVEVVAPGLTGSAISFSRGYFSYDDLVVNITSGTGDAATVDRVAVINFFSNDVLNAAGAIDAVNLVSSPGSVIASFTQAAILSAVLKSGDGDHVFIGYASADSIAGGGNDDWILSGSGNDTVNGGIGNDIVFGGAGADTLTGAQGNDSLLGGAGADTLAGGAGDDLLSGGAGSDTYQFAVGGGHDTISEGFSAGITSEQLDSGLGLRYVVADGDAPLSSDNDQLVMQGLAQADIRFTRAGNDLVLGLAGGDSVTVQGYFALGIGAIENIVLAGGKSLGLSAVKGLVLQPTAGDDSITGYLAGERLNGLGGNDTLDGREGDDILNGGAGNDTLTGGIGKDRFIFDSAPGAASNNVDTLTDFSSGTDTIALSAGVFSALGSAGTRLAANGTTLIYDAATGLLTYDADGLGGADGVVVAILGATVHPLALGSDFLLV